MANTSVDSIPNENKCALSLHKSGNWYKKVRGKFYYFGKDQVKAVKAYEEFTRACEAVGGMQAEVRQDAAIETPEPSARKRHDRRCPLRQHKTGQWYIKIHGKYYYFGKDREVAIRAYEEQATFLHTGKGAPPTAGVDTTLLSLCNQYLDHQESRIKVHEVSPKHYYDQRSRLRSFAKFIGPERPAGGITVLDLQHYRVKLIKDDRKPNEINNHLAAIKALFHWAEDNDVLETIPKLRAVKKVNVKKSERMGRREQDEGKKFLFEPEQIRRLMDLSTHNLRAMILLGINCAFGCTDVAELRWSDLDLEKGTVNLPRGKTGVERNPNLWPETIAALKSIPRRTGPLVFYTKHGNPYVRVNPKSGRPVNNVTAEFGKLLDKAGLKVPKGTNFYTLRRTAATIAAETGNPYAVQGLLGHTTVQMGSTYVQGVKRQTEQAINHVGDWFHRPENRTADGQPDQ